MLLPSKKIFYAIEAVLYIAYNAKAEPVAGNEIAEAQNLPTRYLEPMMQKLVRVGILRGVRGPQGGYMLGRERRRISLADICDALADDALPAATTELGKKILTPAAQKIASAWQTHLAEISMATLCEQAITAKIPLAKPSANDFTI